LSGAADEKQHVVFIYDVKTMERPQQIIPAFVWADRLDEVHGRLVKALYFGEVGFKFVGVLGNREFPIRRPSTAIVGNELPNEKIQGGSQIMDRVSGDGSKARLGLPADHYPGDALPRLNICVGNEQIWVGLQEGLALRFKITDVLFGPFDLDPEAGRPVDLRQD